MLKKEDKKLLIFWLLAIPFLIGWSFFWLHKNNQKQDTFINSSQKTLNEIKTAKDIVDYLSQTDDQTKTFLLLFQNDMELRPAGGYLGSFGIIKIKNGELIFGEAHDSNMFDERIQDKIQPPYPMDQLLKIDRWGLRDSNWFPNFPDTAKKAEEFYKIGKGKENFDGVIAINTKVLNSILEITGPITIEGFSQEFNSGNAVLEIEYEVEKGYDSKNLNVSERKNLIKKMMAVLIDKTKVLDWKSKLNLIKTLEKDLNQKNIQLSFKDEKLQEKIDAIGWSGKIISSWNDDYLMLVDANLGALKSNRVINYSLNYQINLSKEKPEGILLVKITHQGKEKDWITKDYQGYLRVYAPREAWLLNLNELPTVKFSEEYEKKVFGIINKVPLSQTVEYKFVYSLPERFKTQPYKLLIQKQSGISSIQTEITVKDVNGQEHFFNLDLEKDEIIEL